MGFKYRMFFNDPVGKVGLEDIGIMSLYLCYFHRAVCILTLQDLKVLDYDVILVAHYQASVIFQV